MSINQTNQTNNQTNQQVNQTPTNTNTPNPATIIPTEFLSHFYKLSPSAQSKLITFYQTHKSIQPETLCMTCECSCNSAKHHCPWAEAFKPVNGWQTIPTRINQKLNREEIKKVNEEREKRELTDKEVDELISNLTNSYLVIECPLYKKSIDTFDWGCGMQTDKLLVEIQKEFKDCDYKSVNAPKTGCDKISMKKVGNNSKVFIEAHYLFNYWKKMHPNVTDEAEILKVKNRLLIEAEQNVKDFEGED